MPDDPDIRTTFTGIIQDARNELAERFGRLGRQAEVGDIFIFADKEGKSRIEIQDNGQGEVDVVVTTYRSMVSHPDDNVMVIDFGLENTEWKRAEFPHPLITLDYNTDDVAYRVTFVGKSREDMILSDKRAAADERTREIIGWLMKGAPIAAKYVQEQWLPNERHLIREDRQA